MNHATRGTSRLVAGVAILPYPLPPQPYNAPCLQARQVANYYCLDLPLLDRQSLKSRRLLQLGLPLLEMDSCDMTSDDDDASCFMLLDSFRYSSIRYLIT